MNAFQEHAQAGPTDGKIRHRLGVIGIPAEIVTSIQYNGESDILYFNDLFATFKWNEKFIPVFDFKGKYSKFNRFSQDKIFTLYISQNNGLDYVEANSFSKITPIQLMVLGSFRHGTTLYYILNKEGEKVGDDLLPLPPEANTLAEKIKNLNAKFH